MSVYVKRPTLRIIDLIFSVWVTIFFLIIRVLKVLSMPKSVLKKTVKLIFYKCTISLLN